MHPDDFSEELVSHPNDAFCKQVFSKPEEAVALFRRHLPEEVTALADWATLTVHPGSYVKHDLKQIHGDLLFSVCLRDQESGLHRRRSRKELLLYLVFEHQTTVDAMMPLRILVYLLEVLLQHNSLPLPPVIGFVLHQGPEKWTVSQRFEDLFDLPDANPEALLPYLPRFQHLLLDLSQADPAREEENVRLRTVLHLMKLVREKRHLEFFDWLMANYDAWGHELPEELLTLAFYYAWCTDSRLDVESIARRVKGNIALERINMSIAEQLIQKGREEGIEKGREEGIEKGGWIGRIRMLEELLGYPLSEGQELSALSLEALEERFKNLKQRYDFGNRS